MRIAEVETLAYSLPFREEYVTARGALAAREIVLLRLRTDEGVEGLGEAVPLTLRGGDSLMRVERALLRSRRRIGRLDPSRLAGDEPLEAAIDAFIHVAAGRRLAGPAAAALEMAIFDLAGRLSGQPVWRLLRGERAAPVRCNATLAAGAPAPGRRGRAALAGARLRHLQAQARSRRGRRAGARRTRGGWALGTYSR